MRKTLAILVLSLQLLAVAAYACSGGFVFYQSVEIEPGVFKVSRGNGSHLWPESPVLDSVGIYRSSDLKSRIEGIISANELVFIGELDSVIGIGQPLLVDPGIVPDFVLSGPNATLPVFFARIKVDTVIKGILSEGSYWFKGQRVGSTCDINPALLKGLKFMNYSDNLDSTSDLKIDFTQNFCSNCPQALSFDGRYFRFREFPAMTMDITMLYPDYPATGILGSRYPKVPLRRDFRLYSPDGRIVPQEIMRKHPMPVLR